MLIITGDPLEGYQQPPARIDREDQQGGGACIFVAEGLPWDEIWLSGDMEAAAVQLHLPGKQIGICSLLSSS